MACHRTTCQKISGDSERMIRLHYDHVLIDLRSGILTGSDQMDWDMVTAKRQSGAGTRSDS